MNGILIQILYPVFFLIYSEQSLEPQQLLYILPLVLQYAFMYINHQHDKKGYLESSAMVLAYSFLFLEKSTMATGLVLLVIIFVKVDALVKRRLLHDKLFDGFILLLSLLFFVSLGMELNSETFRVFKNIIFLTMLGSLVGLFQREQGLEEASWFGAVREPLLTVLILNYVFYLCNSVSASGPDSFQLFFIFLLSLVPLVRFFQRETLLQRLMEILLFFTLSGMICFSGMSEFGYGVDQNIYLILFFCSFMLFTFTLHRLDVDLRLNWADFVNLKIKQESLLIYALVGFLALGASFIASGFFFAKPTAIDEVLSSKILLMDVDKLIVWMAASSQICLYLFFARDYFLRTQTNS
ncbi:MAG: hypothetical protein AB8E15_03555 [Bdellovibrionales bacterium]